MIPDFITNPDPEIYLSDSFITLDFETTNKEKGSALNEDNRIVYTSYASGYDDVLGISGNPSLDSNFADSISSRTFIVAQNAKFELQWLKRLGYDLSQFLVFDTLLAEYVLAGNRRRKLDLGSISKRRGFGSKDPYIDICMRGGVCPSTMPKPLLHKRCKKDVQQTREIFLQQRQELLENDQLKTLFTRCIFTPVLADIEFNGMHLDEDRVNETYRDYQERFNQHYAEVSQLTGGINFRSPKQLAEFLYDKLGFSEPTDRRGNPIRTGAGNRKTDVATIEGFKTSSAEQRRFIGLYKELNKLSAALTKNLEFFKGIVDEVPGAVFYGNFNQSVTQTHRLSSSGRSRQFRQFGKRGVQFQNLPRIFKKLFRARAGGWKIGEGDGSQLEFRCAAHLGRDSNAAKAIRTGFDVHSYTAQVLTENGEETNRQGAKAHTFKPLYGGRSGTKAQRKYYEAFRDRYPGITKTQNGWITSVLAHKKLTIPSGLTFYWPDTHLEGDYVTNTPSICNYPVQSYATADIIPIAITKQWHEMKARGMQSFLVNTVHDSGISEVHPDEEEVFKEVVFDAFTHYVYFYLDKVYDDKFTVPLGVEVKLGEHWSEGEEFNYDLDPELEEAA